VGGYPDRKAFQARLDDVVDAGFEFIEVGLPFSDPMADGPTITAAMTHVLDAAVKTENIIADLRKRRAYAVPLYVMTYANVVYRYGLERLTEDLKGLVSGIILADVPNRMHPFIRREGLGLPLIPFVTPESRESDVTGLSTSDTPFIYFIGIRGITGTSSRLENPEIVERINWIRQVTGKPVIMGFGIRTKDQARNALSVADGYVIGTAALELQHDEEAYRKFLRSISCI